MKVRTGELRHRIHLQHPNESQDGSGQPVPKWKNITKDIPAAVFATSGGERLRGTQVEAGVDTVVVVRFGLKKHGDYGWPQHRFLHDGRELNIVKAVDEEGTREFLTCQCKEVA